MSHQEAVLEQRPLKSEERALLKALVKRSERAHDYSGQIQRARVVARCGCGCPTVDLDTEGAGRCLVGPSTIIANGRGRDKAGVLVEVILHVREGKLSELEVYAAEGVSQCDLPMPEGLEEIY